MTTTVEAYIGSNNHTHQLEMDKIKRVLARNHKGKRANRRGFVPPEP